MNDNKCPNCGEELVFDMFTQTFKCGKCTNVDVNINDNNGTENVQNNEGFNADNTNVSQSMFTCSSCGASFITNSTITNCVYCNSLVAQKPCGNIVANYIIPFKRNKEDAINIYKKYMKFRWYLPFEFRKKDYIERLTAVYVPFYICDFKCSGNVLFGASDSHKWDDGKFNYDEVKKYDVNCEASFDYEGCIVNLNEIVNDDELKYLEPFDFSNKVDFNNSFIKDSLVEYSSKTKEEKSLNLKKRIMNRSTKMMIEQIKHEKKGIKKNNLNINDINSFYILMPMWVLTYNYYNKKYKFLLSDSNDHVYMNLPIGDVEKIIVSLVMFIICFIISFLVALFL